MRGGDVIVVIVLGCLAVIVLGASLPLTVAVRRLVVPWHKRYRGDGTRIEDGRDVTITVGPLHFSDKPSALPADEPEKAP